MTIHSTLTLIHLIHQKTQNTSRVVIYHLMEKLTSITLCQQTHLHSLRTIISYSQSILTNKTIWLHNLNVMPIAISVLTQIQTIAVNVGVWVLKMVTKTISYKNHKLSLAVKLVVMMDTLPMELSNFQTLNNSFMNAQFVMWCVPLAKDKVR